MTIERAKQIAKQWGNGYVCSLREGEAEEYHKLCFSALRAQQEKENNAPLTLDEMREMGGEPYYHVSLQGGENHWAVLDPFVSENIDVYDYGYGKRWIAYRHKPEEV